MKTQKDIENKIEELEKEIYRVGYPANIKYGLIEQIGILRWVLEESQEEYKENHDYSKGI